MTTSTQPSTHYNEKANFALQRTGQKAHFRLYAIARDMADSMHLKTRTFVKRIQANVCVCVYVHTQVHTGFLSLCAKGRGGAACGFERGPDDDVNVRARAHPFETGYQFRCARTLAQRMMNGHGCRCRRRSPVFSWNCWRRGENWCANIHHTLHNVRPMFKPAFCESVRKLARSNPAAAVVVVVMVALLLLLLLMVVMPNC